MYSLVFPGRGRGHIVQLEAQTGLFRHSEAKSGCADTKAAGKGGAGRRYQGGEVVMQRKNRRALTYVIAFVVIIGGIALQSLLFSGGTLWSLLTSLHHPQGMEAAQEFKPPQARIDRPDFQNGIVFPRWGTDAYGTHDKNWYVGLQEIHDQTSAHWLQMTINLYQPSVTSTHVMATSSTPSAASIAAGIR